VSRYTVKDPNDADQVFMWVLSEVTSCAEDRSLWMRRTPIDGPGWLLLKVGNIPVGGWKLAIEVCFSNGTLTKATSVYKDAIRAALNWR
jgi:hypothetical protein